MFYYTLLSAYPWIALVVILGNCVIGVLNRKERLITIPIYIQWWNNVDTAWIIVIINTGD